MPSRDLMNELTGVACVVPAALKTSTFSSTKIDLNAANSGNNGLCILVQAGAITDGTFTFKLQDSPDDNSNYADVAAAYQLTPSAQTSNAWTSATTSGSILKFGYVGLNRYVKLVCTVSGSPSTGGYISAIGVLGYPFNIPAA